MTNDQALILAQAFFALCLLLACGSYVLCAVHYVLTERKRAAMLARIAAKERKREI